MLNLLFVEGFVLGAGLLIALGPKDAFVIKSNLAGNNAVVLVLICALSDLALIALGVVGLGAVIRANHWVMVVTMCVSIAYLLYFSVRALRSACVAQTSLDSDDTALQPAPRAQVIKGALFHSLLSPFAWLDTVLVVGSISATKLGVGKFYFAAGAVVASFMWFTTLTLGSRLVAPLFRSRRVWQGLDLLVCVSMLVLATKLALDHPWI